MASRRNRILLAAAVVVVVLGVAGATVGWRFLVHTHQGYFSPVFSPDRRDIYFLERRTRGVVWGLGIEHFTPPAHAYVLDDRIALKRLRRDSGTVQTLARWPSTPLVRRRIRSYRNRIFVVLSARLQFDAHGTLEYGFGLSIPKQPRSESWSVRGTVPAGASKAEAPPWQPGDRRLYGHARHVLDGEWELIHFFGEAAYPPAIVTFDRETRRTQVVIEAPGFRDQFPDGVPEHVLAQRSVRDAVERIDALARTRERLLAEFREQGLADGDARLRTTDRLRELGYLATPETITARALDDLPSDAALFRITRHEFQVGLFQDIDRAIRAPGTPVELGTGTWLRYDGFDTSEKLKRFVDEGGMRFYLQTDDGAYEITRTPSRPASR
jgi:hypothetical protein